MRNVSDKGEGYLIEIKCPFMLEICFVKDLDKSLSKSQETIFALNANPLTR